MKQESGSESILGSYRALDLADEKGLLCGMLLGDLGADVIKIEPPGGDSARSIGPFYHDQPDPEKSLYWFAFNRNKRGITLDIESADGRDIFKRLVKTADFVIESFPPGYLAGLGLGYAELEKINPRIILVSVTDWGQDGPYVEKGWKADEMVLWALGGMMWLSGDIDRPPVQISFPHPYLHAGAEAAAGAMAAHYYREMTGEGQHVELSVQECIPYANVTTTSSWELEGIMVPRGTMKMGSPRADGKIIPSRSIWQCKDGYVVGMFGGGMLKVMSLSSEALVRWMAEEGMADDLTEVNWSSVDYRTAEVEVLQHRIDLAQRFLLTKTKAEIYERCVKEKILFAPISNPGDIATNPQLVARDFFVETAHRDLGEALTYCGPFAKLSETPLTRWFRAPLIGEHNSEILGEELGFSTEKLAALKQAKAI